MFLASALIFSLVLSGSIVSANAEVTHEDEGRANYVGVEWSFAYINKQVGHNCGEGSCLGLSPSYIVRVTVRRNGQVTCNEQYDFSHEALSYKGKWYWLCGQPAIIEGPGDTLRTYYNVPGVAEGWVDAPSHCHIAGLINTVCNRYWYVNWD